jgi:hypothetical protein
MCPLRQCRRNGPWSHAKISQCESWCEQCHDQGLMVECIKIVLDCKRDNWRKHLSKWRRIKKNILVLSSCSGFCFVGLICIIVLIPLWHRFKSHTYSWVSDFSTILPHSWAQFLQDSVAEWNIYIYIYIYINHLLKKQDGISRYLKWCGGCVTIKYNTLWTAKTFSIYSRASLLAYSVSAVYRGPKNIEN